ncbi:class I glutamine amidotransferase-like protein [Panaeolus papilionaceus]|nr:class I glutamine amidotransferase-like protein [Panaeolus papilionaceus]
MKCSILIVLSLTAAVLANGPPGGHPLHPPKPTRTTLLPSSSPSPVPSLPLPTNYGVLLFPAFQALDVFGPLDVLSSPALKIAVNLSIISTSYDPVITKHQMMGINSTFGEAIVPTHTFDNPPNNLEVLIVPGGMGTRAPSPQLDPYVKYIKEVYPSLRYLISVCTGAALVARSGVLNGHSATGNKLSWAFVTSQVNATEANIHWISHARWVQSGNIWTTSGVAAGIDGVFDFVKTVYGETVASNIANGIEYERELDWKRDPFADLYNLTDVNP